MVVRVVWAPIDKANFSFHYAAIAAVTACAVTNYGEAAPFNDFGKFVVCASQAGHDTGNSTVAVRSRSRRARAVAKKIRAAQSKRIPSGARRLSSRDRWGSSSFEASST
jgi:hypothetical protein